MATTWEHVPCTECGAPIYKNDCCWWSEEKGGRIPYGEVRALVPKRHLKPLMNRFIRFCPNLHAHYVKEKSKNSVKAFRLKKLKIERDDSGSVIYAPIRWDGRGYPKNGPRYRYTTLSNNKNHQPLKPPTPPDYVKRGGWVHTELIQASIDELDSAWATSGRHWLDHAKYDSKRLELVKQLKQLK